MFNKSEIKAMVISIFVIALAIGFDDGSAVFQWTYWIGNFLRILFLSGVALIAHVVAQKVSARMNGFEAEYTYWGIQSFGLKNIFHPYSRTNIMTLMGKSKEKPFPRKIRFLNKEYLIHAFPIGVVLSLIITVATAGKAFFLAIGEYTLLYKREGHRLGRKYLEVTQYEEAKIALAGPMTNIALIAITKVFNQHGIFDYFILINAALALFHMLPLPGLAGSKVYLGSRLLYVSCLVFMIAMVILAYTVSAIPMLIISLLSLVVAGALYYYYAYFL